MTKPDFSQMSRQDLRAYVLAHREDDAIGVLINRGSHGPRYKFPQTKEDFKEMKEILRNKLSTS
jgi:putative AlgH/UPF0301 family transcriptional regulator